MSRRSTHSAYHTLMDTGPFYPAREGLNICLFCYQGEPYHYEYCPWQDFFFSWNDPDPMDINEFYDKSIPENCDLNHVIVFHHAYDSTRTV